MSTSIPPHEEQLHSLLTSPERSMFIRHAMAANRPASDFSHLIRGNTSNNNFVQRRIVCNCTPTNILTIVYCVVLYLFLTSDGDPDEKKRKVNIYILFEFLLYDFLVLNPLFRLLFNEILLLR